MTSNPHPEHSLERLARGKTLSRRQFIGLIGAVAAGEFAASQLGPIRRLLASGTAGGSSDGVTIFLYLGGGNDGLNTVIPRNPAEYAQYVNIRTKTVNGVTSSIAYPEPNTPNRRDSMLVGDSSIGFNPGMTNISQWYRSGKVAVIQGVGYSNANFSHFESQEHWWGGSGAPGSPVSYKAPSGWLGRFADTAGLTSIGAVSINGGGSLNPSLRSLSSDALAISPWQGNRLGQSTSTRDQRAAVAVQAMSQQTTLGALGNDWGRVGANALALAPTVAGAYAGIDSGWSGLKRQLTMAANLVNANLGTRVIHTDTGGFDTHENQRKANSKGVEWHTGLWMDIDDSLNNFFATLSAANRRRVNVVIYSEFGRRADMNGTYGTDHGAGSVALVIGDNVRGGTYGTYPSLFDLRDPETGGGGNLKSGVDFRQIYATILEGWLGVPAQPILGAQHQQLAFIAAAPGDVVGATTTTSSSTTSSSTTSSTTSSTSSTTSSTTSTTSSTLAPTTTVAPTTTSIGATTSTVATTTTNPTTSIVTTTTVLAATTTTTTTPTTTPTTVAPTTIPETTVPTTAATTTIVTTTTVPATVATSTSSTSTSTTTMAPNSGIVPPTPATTPTPSNPDTTNVVTISVVPPAPPPAAPRAEELVFADSSASTTTAPPTTSTAPSTTTTPTTTTAAAPTTTSPASTVAPTKSGKTTAKPKATSRSKPPVKLALVDSNIPAASSRTAPTRKKVAARSKKAARTPTTLKARVAAYRNKSTNR